MNYGDHNFIKITQQTKLRVALDVSSQSSSSCQACRAMQFDKLDTAKMHGLDTSNVSSRVESRCDEPSGIWAMPSFDERTTRPPWHPAPSAPHFAADSTFYLEQFCLRSILAPQSLQLSFNSFRRTAAGPFVYYFCEESHGPMTLREYRSLLLSLHGKNLLATPTHCTNRKA